MSCDIEKREFERLRLECLERLEAGDRRKALLSEVLDAIEGRYGYAPLVRQQLLAQMVVDLRAYSLFDALAMWLDPKLGLVAYGAAPVVVPFARAMLASEERRGG